MKFFSRLSVFDDLPARLIALPFRPNNTISRRKYMGHWIWQLLVGLIVGILARFLLPGREALPEGALGLLLTAIIGVVGALIGTWIGRSLWGGENYTAGWIMSILGAIILLILFRLLFGRGSATTS
jgi:uncharacterized membrane protein YeaQ/YmgE (transglycosylase-associated protein family)